LVVDALTLHSRSREGGSEIGAPEVLKKVASENARVDVGGYPCRDGVLALLEAF